jgi:hypothetical protein
MRKNARVGIRTASLSVLHDSENGGAARCATPPELKRYYRFTYRLIAIRPVPAVRNKSVVPGSGTASP